MVKGDIQLLATALSDPSHKTLLAQLLALLGVCQTRLLHTSSSSNNSSSNNNNNNSSSRPLLGRSAMSAWDWQLQESGIFEEDHSLDDVKDADVIQVAVPVIEETPARVWTNREKAVQTIRRDVHEKSMQTHQGGNNFSSVSTYHLKCI